jgi:hypothetical protein
VYLENTSPSLVQGESVAVELALSGVPLNLDFENSLAGWQLGGDYAGLDHKLHVDAGNAYEGHGSATLVAKAATTTRLGALEQWFRADRYRGQKLRLSGYLKAHGLTHAARLFLGVTGPERGSGVLGDPILPGAGEDTWQRYELVLDVPPDGLCIQIGASLQGAGQIWIDGLEFGVDKGTTR